jgi:sugar phosphate isomerase/epimerase
LGTFGEKHKMMIGYHGHTDITSPEAFGRPESWETAMSYSKYNGINLDIGHFIAGNSMSPIPFLQKYHSRVTHIHLKDRKMRNGPNTAWGEGDTPIKETLQLMQKEKYPFPGVIEMEYTVPAGSDLITEIAKCVEFCKNALV